MSDAVSALQGRVSEGTVSVGDTGPRGMITLRGELGKPGLRDAVALVAGTDVPARGEIGREAQRAVAWMSPDEILILLPYAEAPAATDRLAKALSRSHALVANVSDARAVISVSGRGARDVLAKVIPADLSPDVFRERSMRRTRLAQVPCALWMTGADDFEVMCFRSVAHYAFDVLRTAARERTEVGFHTR